MSIDKVVTMITDSIGALATVVTTVIVILTYIKAKQTFFQPMRNEVFKLQLELFSKIMKMLCDKDEGSIWELFNFEEIIRYNAFVLKDAYLLVYFNIPSEWSWILNDEEIDERMENYDENKQDWIPTGPIGEFSHRGKHFFVGPYVRPVNDIPENIVERRKLWSAYKQFSIYLPNSFWEKENQIRDFYTSPFLPQKIAALLKGYDEAIFTNLSLLARALTSVARQMPKVYPTKESIEEIGLIDNWVRNEFIHIRLRRKEEVEPAKRIAEKIREYMGTESVFRNN